MDASPSIPRPPGSGSGLPAMPPEPMSIRGRTFVWGSRTYLMGIVNVTPDSFSGDGLLARSGTDSTDPEADHIPRAVLLGRRMAAEGADLLDVGGESSRPGHEQVDEAEELRRVVPVIRALRQELPDLPISVDTIKVTVARAALDAGADVINDVGGVGPSDGLPALAAERGVPYVLMHDRDEAGYGNLMAEVLADLQGAIDRALSLGLARERLIIDPGIGFGKTAEHNLHLLAHLGDMRLLARPILVGTSRKSTIGKVLDLPPHERLEGTLATTALAVAAGADMVRVHDVAANRRAARMADAIHRHGRLGPAGWEPS